MINPFQKCAWHCVRGVLELSREIKSNTRTHCFQPVTFLITLTTDLCGFLYTEQCLPETWMCLKPKCRSVNLREHGAGPSTWSMLQSWTSRRGSFSVGVSCLSFFWWPPLPSSLEAGGSTRPLGFLAHSWKESDTLWKKKTKANLSCLYSVCRAHMQLRACMINPYTADILCAKPRSLNSMDSVITYM